MAEDTHGRLSFVAPTVAMSNGGVVR
jgi:hypothetical protein